MSNTCWNRLEIAADSDELRHIKNDTVALDGSVSFGLLLPAPYAETFGSHWAMDYWGTAADAIESRVEYIPQVRALNFTFSSLRCPPTAWLTALATKYPGARMRMTSGSRECDVHMVHSVADGQVALDVAESMIHHREYWAEILAS